MIRIFSLFLILAWITSPNLYSANVPASKKPRPSTELVDIGKLFTVWAKDKEDKHRNALSLFARRFQEMSAMDPRLSVPSRAMNNFVATIKLPVDFSSYKRVIEAGAGFDGLSATVERTYNELHPDIKKDLPSLPGLIRTVQNACLWYTNTHTYYQSTQGHWQIPSSFEWFEMLWMSRFSIDEPGIEIAKYAQQFFDIGTKFVGTFIDNNPNASLVSGAAHLHMVYIGYLHLKDAPDHKKSKKLLEERLTDWLSNPRMHLSVSLIDDDILHRSSTYIQEIDDEHILWSAFFLNSLAWLKTTIRDLNNSVFGSSDDLDSMFSVLNISRPADPSVGQRKRIFREIFARRDLERIMSATIAESSDKIVEWDGASFVVEMVDPDGDCALAVGNSKNDVAITRDGVLRQVRAALEAEPGSRTALQKDLVNYFRGLRLNFAVNEGRTYHDDLLVFAGLRDLDDAARGFSERIEAVQDGNFFDLQNSYYDLYPKTELSTHDKFIENERVNSKGFWFFSDLTGLLLKHRNIQFVVLEITSEGVVCRYDNFSNRGIATDEATEIRYGLYDGRHYDRLIKIGD